MRFSKRQQHGQLAQEVYRAMLREHVAPALRAAGWKGSGSAYLLPSPGYWAQLGFQKDRYSTADQVRFTVNLSVVPRDVWACAHDSWPSQLSARPSANTDSGALIREVDRHHCWWGRIGLLMPEHNDHWWEISSGEDAASVGRDVVDAIREHAIPALRAKMTGCT